MNKKLLGIAAVALLGVSAAFAATTSTVYFTASGTLTKVLDSQVKDQTDALEGDGTGETDSDKEAIGVSYVENKIANGVKMVYNGNSISSGDATYDKISINYFKSTRVATGITDNLTVDNPSYVYKDISISGLNFSKKGDYLYLPFKMFNATGYEASATFMTSYLEYDGNNFCAYELKNDKDNTYISGLTEDSNDVTSTYFKVVIARFNYSTDTSGRTFNDNTITQLQNIGSATTYNTGDADYNYFGTSKSLNCGLFIELQQNITTSTLNGSFSGLKIKLPSFTVLRS